ncbi:MULTISPECIES: ferredoxin [Haloarcula]|uniref:ferredoxin n=1 Tax=Haloarcula TaxID=2237 RepID=UPI0023ED7E90|nr:ferredoxin [Halomicroarcula sp. XH51]
MYRITLDRATCDGVFACLVRDDRFVEDGDGLAAIEVDDERTVAATFDDDRRDDAASAAAACPLDAITVEDVSPAADRTEGEP